jgi:hypothetical protein
MQRRTTTALIVAMLGAAAAAQAPEKRTTPDLQGKLYRSVFSSSAGLLSKDDLPAVPEPLRGRLDTFLARRAAFKSSYKSSPDDLKMVRSDAKRRQLERSIVAMLDVPGVEKMAAEFVAAAPIAHEWEGLPERPLEEANFAENVLKKDPSSPLAPWLYVFIAQRQRIAFEALENVKNEDGMKAAAKKYRAFADRARAAEDVIYAALFDDMERQPFLYIKGARHPRDYDPDS